VPISLNNVTPIVPVSNMAESISFFQDALGFSVRQKSAGYAYVSRDAVSFSLVPAGANKDLDSPNSQQHCYINVTEIDQLYAELEPQLRALPEGRVKAPFETNYGQREFHVIDPDALLISFGEKSRQ